MQTKCWGGGGGGWGLLPKKIEDCSKFQILDWFFRFVVIFGFFGGNPPPPPHALLPHLVGWSVLHLKIFPPYKKYMMQLHFVPLPISLSF